MEIKPHIYEIRQSEDYGEFAIEPLPRGYGRTLGTALRRILLSSLPGAAVTSLKVEGVLYEFGTIAGVLESLAEIVSNVKGVRFRLKSDEPQTVTLRKEGVREVKAGDIETNPLVEVLNEDHHLAELTIKDAQLVMQMVVSPGKGYVPAERHASHEIGVIGVDALFSPVKKVNVLVEDTRVGQATDFNKLVLQIWTDRSIQPRESIEKAAKILVQYFSLLVPSANGKGKIGETVRKGDHGGKSIEEIGFGTRTYNCLKRAKINTLEDLLSKSKEDLLTLENFGKTSLQEVMEKLEELGLSLQP